MLSGEPGILHIERFRTSRNDSKTTTVRLYTQTLIILELEGQVGGVCVKPNHHDLFELRLFFYIQIILSHVIILKGSVH